MRKVGERAVKKAGLFACKKYKNFNRATIKLKVHNELLTKVDLMSESIIISEIKKNFPEHHILSEESGDNRFKSDFLWIIDPIDGTTNFTMHNPIWAVSVGLAYRGEIVLGFVYAPCLKELYVAEINKGSRLNSRKIRVSNVYKGKVLNAFCSARDKKSTKKAVKYFSHHRLHGGACYLLGSASLELAYVAAGRLESMMIPGAHSWDVAAGILLVREAGGVVTDFKGKEWTLKSKDMLASNGAVHDDLLRIV